MRPSTRCLSSGMACRATMSPDAYQPLSTLEMKEQLSNVGVVSAEQSMSPGFLITPPVVVSYHWYRKPTNRFRCCTSVSVARSTERACGRPIKPRSLGDTTAHRCTPMFEAEGYRPHPVG